MQAIGRLESAELELLARELRAGRLAVPITGMALTRWFDDRLVPAIAADLKSLESLAAPQLATLLEAIIQDRRQRRNDGAVELVATSPTESGSISRDTSAVVQSMFAAAMESVDVVGYAIYQGRDVFRVLAERMEVLPDLRVRMFLNVARALGDTSLSSEVVRRFFVRFGERDWPKGKRLPELYYDPRAALTEPELRASLHAKCVIVDRRALFVSSANFTEAGHERNIEVGVRLDMPELAIQLQGFLDQLIERGVLVCASSTPPARGS